jgi:hypothetical protein
LPRAKLAQGEGGTLRVGVGEEVPPQVVLVHGKQVAFHLGWIQEFLQAAHGPNPGAQDAVGQAALAVLVFGALAFQQGQGFLGIVDVPEPGP